MQIALAQAAEMRGDIDHALQVYEEALQVDNKRADVHHRIARLYDRKGDYNKALVSYQKAQALAPTNAEIHCDLAYCYYLHQQYPEAEKSLLAALRLQPEFPRAHANYGLLLARTGRENDSLSEFAKAGATESQTHVNLAFTMLLDQRYQEAIQQLQLASDRDTAGQCRSRIAHLRQVVSVAQANRTAPPATDGLVRPGTY